MTFEVGQNYERQTDGMAAVVEQIDASNNSALLRLTNTEKTWIRLVDVPRQWRLYELCPECSGVGYAVISHDNKHDFAKLPSHSACPTCKGSRRVYP